MSDIIKIGAYKFGGINRDHIVFEDQSFDMNRGSFSFWMYVPERLSHDSVIFRSGNRDVINWSGYRTIAVEYYSGFYNLKYSIIKAIGTNTEVTLYSSEQFEYNKWYNVVISFDYSYTYLNQNTLVNITDIFINGVRDSSVGPTPSSQNIDVLHCSGSSSLGIGYKDGAIEDNTEFEGFLTQFSVWSVNLNQSDAYQIYNNGSPFDLSQHDKVVNLVSWYLLNDAAPYRRKRPNRVKDVRRGLDGTLKRNGVDLILSKSYKTYIYPGFVDDEDIIGQMIRTGKRNGFVAPSLPDSDYGFRLLSDSDDKSEIERTYTWPTKRVNFPRFTNAGYTLVDDTYSVYDNTEFSAGFTFISINGAGFKQSLLHRATDNTNANTEYKVYLDTSNNVVFEIIDTSNTSHTITSTVVAEQYKKYSVVVRYSESLDEGNIDVYSFEDGTVDSTTGASMLGGSMNSVSGAKDLYTKAHPYSGSNEFVSSLVYDAFSVNKYLSDDEAGFILSGSSPISVLESSGSHSIGNLLYYVPLDDNSSTTSAVDVSVYDRTVVLYSVIWQTEDDSGFEFLKNHLYLDGVAAYTKVRNYTDIHSGSFTFGAEIQSNNNSGVVAFVGTATDKAGSYEWKVSLLSSGGNAIIRFYLSDGASVVTVSSPHSFGIGASSLIRFVCKYDAIAKGMSLVAYDVVNDVLSTGTASFTNTRNYLTNSYFFFGAEHNGATTTSFLSGKIYNSFYLNRAVEAEEMYDYVYSGSVSGVLGPMSEWKFNEERYGQFSSETGKFQHYMNTAQPSQF